MPDILIPYKRYGSESIEAVVEGDNSLVVAADDSTLSRWRIWFNHLSTYFAECLASINARYNKDLKISEQKQIVSLKLSPLHKIWNYVGNAQRWLARVVQPITNLNLWVHTRSAFLSRS